MKNRNAVGDDKNKVLFGSVVYNSVFQYLDEFIDSISSQTTEEFDILLLNDGIPTEELRKKVLPIQNRCTIMRYATKYSPSELRIKLIQEAKKYGADILVIGDADDLFSDNRVKSVIETFKVNLFADFVYNELRLFNGDKVMPEIPEQINNVEGIAEKNFLGMSNTAIRINALEDDFIESLLECDSYVFDWYLYSRLLLAGHEGVKVKETYTMYRIYDGNCVGVMAMTEEAVKKEIEIKKQHYRLLRKRDEQFGKLYNCYKDGKIRKKNLGVEIDACHYWWDFTKAVGL